MIHWPCTKPDRLLLIKKEATRMFTFIQLACWFDVEGEKWGPVQRTTGYRVAQFSKFPLEYRNEYGKVSHFPRYTLNVPMNADLVHSASGDLKTREHRNFTAPEEPLKSVVVRKPFPRRHHARTILWRRSKSLNPLQGMPCRQKRGFLKEGVRTI